MAALGWNRTKWNYPGLSVVMYQRKLGKSVSTERWHYVSWDDGKAGEMLTDHLKDPYERKNLAADPAYTKTVSDMSELLRLIP